jgi:hypothetical protein
MEAMAWARCSLEISMVIGVFWHHALAPGPAATESELLSVWPKSLQARQPEAYVSKMPVAPADIAQAAIKTGAMCTDCWESGFGTHIKS